MKINFIKTLNFQFLNNKSYFLFLRIDFFISFYFFKNCYYFLLENDLIKTIAKQAKDSKHGRSYTKGVWGIWEAICIDIYIFF